jgi:hypothetical protein
LAVSYGFSDLAAHPVTCAVALVDADVSGLSHVEYALLYELEKTLLDGVMFFAQGRQVPIPVVGKSIQHAKQVLHGLVLGCLPEAFDLSVFEVFFHNRLYNACGPDSPEPADGLIVNTVCGY